MNETKVRLTKTRNDRKNKLMERKQGEIQVFRASHDKTKYMTCAWSCNSDPSNEPQK